MSLRIGLLLAGHVDPPSRQSVYDDLPWISGLEDLLRRFLADEAPFLGICFGHQLLAQALGGRVQRSERGWGVGIHRYDVLEPLPWFVPDAGDVALIASHQGAPPGAGSLDTGGR